MSTQLKPPFSVCSSAVELGNDVVMYCTKKLTKLDTAGIPCHDGPCRPPTLENYCGPLYRYWLENPLTDAEKLEI